MLGQYKEKTNVIYHAKYPELTNTGYGLTMKIDIKSTRFSTLSIDTSNQWRFGSMEVGLVQGRNIS